MDLIVWGDEIHNDKAAFVFHSRFIREVWNYGKEVFPWQVVKRANGYRDFQVFISTCLVGNAAKTGSGFIPQPTVYAPEEFPVSGR